VIVATKKCPHCDTALEFTTDLGKCMVFTAHDDRFCTLVTRERVRMLEQVILSQRESYERRIADEIRGIDAMLVKRGLPTLDEMAKPERDRGALKLENEIVESAKRAAGAVNHTLHDTACRVADAFVASPLTSADACLRCGRRRANHTT
jgi:hypothetical protein